MKTVVLSVDVNGNIVKLDSDDLLNRKWIMARVVDYVDSEDDTIVIMQVKLDDKKEKRRNESK
jgi:hypothetical protein